MTMFREIVRPLFSTSIFPIALGELETGWIMKLGHGMTCLAFFVLAWTLWRGGLSGFGVHPTRKLVRTISVIIALAGLWHAFALLPSNRQTYQATAILLVVAGAAAWYGLSILLRAQADSSLRKRSEELEDEIATRTRELRAALAELQALIECMPVVVWTARPDGTVDSYNRRWSELTGLEAKRTGDDLFWEPVVHPDDAKHNREQWFRAIISGQPYEHQTRFRDRATGQYHWYLARALPLRDESGEIVKWFGTATDINDQILAEEALRQSEAELEAKVSDRTEELGRTNASLQAELAERRASQARHAVELAVAATLVKAKTRKQAIGQVVEAITTGFEFSQGEFWKVDTDLGRLRRESLGILEAGDGTASSLTDSQPAISQGEKLAEAIWRLGRPCGITLDGTIEVLSQTSLDEGKLSPERLGFPIVSENEALGALIFAEGGSQAISPALLETFAIIGHEVALFIERQRVERALRDSEQRFRAIFDHAFQFVGLTTPEGVMVEANETVLKFASLKREDIIGRPCWETPWVHSEVSRERLKETIARAASGQLVRYEGALRGTNDKLTPIDFSVKPLVNESGKVDLLLLEGHDISSQIGAAEALRQSEERFRGAFDAAAIGMALVGPDGRFLQVNRSLCEMIGYTEEELIATNFQTITHPDDLNADLHQVKRMLAGEIRTYHMDKRYFHKSGHTIWITLNVSLVRDEAGQPLHFVSQIQDVTPQKKAEEARRFSESTIRSIFDGSPFMMGIVEIQDDEIFHITGNAATEANMRRYGFKSVHNQYISSSSLPESVRLEWLARYRECALSGQPVRFEYSTPTRKGEDLRWVSATACPIESPGGSRSRFAYVAEDVTERKAAEQARNRLSAILEATSDLVSIADSNARLLYLNRAGRELLGFGPDEDLSRYSVEDMHPAWVHDKIRNEAAPIAMHEGVWRGETAFLARDGREVPTSQVIIIHKSANGDVDYYSTVARDITEQRRTEQRLRTAHDRAMAATKAKSTFLANMSHEIRTPMNAIVGMSELLLDTNLDVQQYDCAATIRNSAEAMLEIVNDILDLSKIEAGKMAVESVEFHLGDLLEEVADLIAPRAHQKGLQVVCLVPSDLPDPLVGDPHRIRQILTNLVSNAVKFTEVGEIVLEARCLNEHERKSEIQVSVRDTGIGIPIEKQSLIFDSFTQADGGTSRRYGGTGLGLTICRQLAWLMGGTILLESESGMGSTFSLKLTLARGNSQPSTKLTSRKVEKSLRILVVDTNDTNRLAIHEYLHQIGCQAEEAGSARQALALLREAVNEQPFDLVLLDSRMPEMDGERFAQTIRREAGMTDLPLVLMSPNTPGEQDFDAQASLFAAQLFKPIRRSQLLNIIVDVIEKRATPYKTWRPAWDDAGMPVAGGLGLHVLVADDHPTNRKVALRMLDALGCHADTASDGRAAIEAIARRRYDVVLMDVQMPGMDGLTATAEVRRRERENGQRTTILAMTAHAMEGDRERCLDAGMDGYISKPVRQKELREMLERCKTHSPALELLPPESPLGGETSFQWSEFVKRFDGDLDFACMLAGSVLATTVTGLDELRAAVALGNNSQIHATAHGLKGNCLTIGAEALAAALLDLELAGRRGDTDSAVQSLEKVESLWASLAEQLREGIASKP